MSVADIFETMDYGFAPETAAEALAWIVDGNQKINYDLLNKVKWFDEEIKSDVNVDFFHKKSTNYTKKMQAITSDSLF